MPRHPSSKTLVDRQLGRDVPNPILPAGDSHVVPNHSGDHSAGRVDTTPTQDLDLVNKKYVDNQDDLFVLKTGDSMSGVLSMVEANRIQFRAATQKINSTAANVLDIISPTLDFLATTEFKIDSPLITIQDDNKIQFRDTGLFINSSADGQLDIDADTEVEITAPTVTVNGDLDVVAGNIEIDNARTYRAKDNAGTRRSVAAISTGDDLLLGDIALDDTIIKSGLNANGIVIKDTTGRVGIATNSPLAKLDVRGGVAFDLTTKTSAYSAVATTDHTILCGPGNETFTVTLPSPALNSQVIFNIKNIGTGTITVATATGNIDNASTAVISSQFSSITVHSDGTNWWII